MRIGLATFAIFLALAPLPAKSAFDTGNELYEYCTAKDNGKQLLCMGLVTGYFEGMQAGYNCKSHPKVTRGQLVDIVLQFLREHPADRHLPASLLAARAFFVSFDCKRAK